MNEAILNISLVAGFTFFVIFIIKKARNEVEHGSGVDSKKFKRVIDKLDKKLQEE